MISIRIVTGLEKYIIGSDKPATLIYLPLFKAASRQLIILRNEKKIVQFSGASSHF